MKAAGFINAVSFNLQELVVPYEPHPTLAMVQHLMYLSRLQPVLIIVTNFAISTSAHADASGHAAFRNYTLYR